MSLHVLISIGPSVKLKVDLEVLETPKFFKTSFLELPTKGIDSSANQESFLSSQTLMENGKTFVVEKLSSQTRQKFQAARWSRYGRFLSELNYRFRNSAIERSSPFICNDSSFISLSASNLYKTFFWSFVKSQNQSPKSQSLLCRKQSQRIFFLLFEHKTSFNKHWLFR